MRRSFLDNRVLVVALLLLSACTSVPMSTQVSDEPFPVVAAEKVFTAGFNHISRKYIDEVALSPLARLGLRALTALDPEVTVYEQDGYVSLTVEERDVLSMPMPEPNDVDGWSHLVALITLEASRHSEDIMNADVETIYETVFDGALSTLDTYSSYAGADEANVNRAAREGYGGIGIRFKVRDGRATVTKVIKNSPSDVAGINTDDHILTVDGKTTTSMNARDISAALRGLVNTVVVITISDERGDVSEHRISRAHIIPPTVSTKREDGVLYVKVKSFNQDTARSFSNSIRDAFDGSDAGEPLGGIIVDLRGNPGGLLKQSIELADTLLIAGDILNTAGRHPDSIQHYEAAGDDVARGLPLVVLIDGRSASASEIVAAALQDQSRAVILGTNSYGKGTIQTVIRLPNDGEMTLTWSRFMAPSGYALQGLGVYPVVCTSGSVEAADISGLAATIRDDRTPEVLDSWRDTPLAEVETRRDLRTKCPSERRTDDADIDMARALIGDRTLYAQALEISKGHQIAAE